MAVLNSQVLRSSRGAAAPVSAATRTGVALPSGSSNALLAGQRVAVHSCQNGGPCVCSGAGCQGAVAAASAGLDATASKRCSIQKRCSQPGNWSSKWHS